jgi:hypothetical protein
VNRGLREAFGVTELEDISRITLGQTSSLVFRIVVGGSPYLLKIITRARARFSQAVEDRDEVLNRDGCVAIAYEQGVLAGPDGGCPVNAFFEYGHGAQEFLPV